MKWVNQRKLLKISIVIITNNLFNQNGVINVIVVYLLSAMKRFEIFSLLRTLIKLYLPTKEARALCHEFRLDIGAKL